MTRTSSQFSLITLALYRHPCVDEQCITQKYKGKKYWFYTIHFLKYIQSKIIYVAIKSCSQSARVCAIICICVSVYQKISHSQEFLKATTYLVKE